MGSFNSEVLTMIEEPIQYTDMSERDFIKWNLDYTMGQIIKLFESIRALIESDSQFSNKGTN